MTISKYTIQVPKRNRNKRLSNIIVNGDYVVGSSSSSSIIGGGSYANLLTENEFNEQQKFIKNIVVGTKIQLGATATNTIEDYLGTTIVIKKDLSVEGNLSVVGRIDRYNQTELNIGDTFINLGTAQPTAINGGIRLYSANGSTLESELKYNVSNSRWEFDKAVKSSGEIISTNVNQFRMVYGNYGAFWRNDGSDLYLLLTASADQYGTYNSLRPFRVNLSTGSVSNTTGFATTNLYTNAIAKNTNGSPIVLNAGNDSATGARVYWNLQVYDTIQLTDNNYNIQGSIKGETNQLKYTATSGHIFNNNVAIGDTDTTYKLRVAANVGTWTTILGNAHTGSYGLLVSAAKSIIDARNSQTDNKILHVHGDGQVAINKNTFTSNIAFEVNGNSLLGSGLESGSYIGNTSAAIWLRTGGNLVLYNNSADRLTAYSSGYVGIGSISTTNLSAGSLRVQGTIDTNDTATGAFRIYNGATFKGGFGTYQWGNGTAVNGISLYSAAGNINLHVESNTPSITMSNTTFGSPTYASGFAGNGWRIDNPSNVSSLTIDNLVVRREMQVYSLNVEKIRSGNGSYWFSDGVKALTATDFVTLYDCYAIGIDTNNGTIAQPFVVGDIVRCQNWTGTGIKYYEGRIQWVSGDGQQFNIEASTLTGSGIPAVGDEIVRVGSSVTGRKGAVYITANDTNAPYIEVVDGKSTIGGAFTTKVRLGKLDGITDTNAGLSGSQSNYYGLYSDNVHLKGHIYSTSGNIGGWVLDPSKLYNGGLAGSSSAGIELNSSSKYINLNKDATNYIKMYYTSSGDWGLIGKNAGSSIFQLGSTNTIAAFTFDSGSLYSGGKWNTASAGVEVNSESTYFSAHYNATNYIKMYYTSSSNWGLVGKNAGNTVFQLGSTNTIAAFTFDNTKLTSTYLDIDNASIIFKGTSQSTSKISYLAGANTVINMNVDTAYGGFVIASGGVSYPKFKISSGTMDLTSSNLLNITATNEITLNGSTVKINFNSIPEHSYSGEPSIASGTLYKMLVSGRYQLFVKS